MERKKFQVKGMFIKANEMTGVKTKTYYARLKGGGLIPAGEDPRFKASRTKPEGETERGFLRERLKSRSRREVGGPS